MAETVALVIQAVVAWTGQLLTLAALVGLFVRRRYRLCYAFVAYLLVVLAGDLLLLLGPSKLREGQWLYGLLGAAGFYSKTFWLLKELTINPLQFAVALELAYRTFRSFPGARSTARGILFLLIGITLFSVIAITPEVATADEADYVNQMMGRLQPRVLNGTVWLLTAIGALVLWYRLPVDRFHKAILIGLVAYLLVFTVGLNAIDTYEWSEPARQAVNYVATTAYLVLVAYWARAAWAPLRAPAQAREPAPVLERQAG